MKDRFIKTVLELFHTYGIKTVTMDDISKELGISKRTLYKYFDSKECLVTECVKHRIIQEKLFQNENPELLELLLNCFKHTESLRKTVDPQCCQDLKKYHFAYTFLSQSVSDYATLCKNNTPAAIQQGYIRKEITPDLIYFFVEKYLSKLFFDPNVNSSDSFTDTLRAQTILIFTRGISTIKGRAYIDQELKKKQHEVC